MTADELKKMPLFSSMEVNMLREFLAENMIFTRHYTTGSTVHNQRDTCTSLEVVLSGALVAYSLAENGSSIAMFEFGENSIIGANLLLGDDHVYPLNIYCEKPCQLLHIKKQAVLELLHDYGFVLQYVKSLSMNSQNMNRKIAMLTQRTLRENLLEYLRKQSILQGSDTVLLPISKKELADYLGVQRPSLFRELKRLKDEGYIDIHNRSIRLMAERAQ